MQEALTLFDSICNSRWFVKTSIVSIALSLSVTISLMHNLQILFLNKIDLFAEKLPRSPLGDYFPDYNGGSDYNSACEYLLQRFVSLNQSAATKQIYAHYTCATDTNQIRCMLFLLSQLFVHRILNVLLFVSRPERHLRHPPANSFAGVRPLVNGEIGSADNLAFSKCRFPDQRTRNSETPAMSPTYSPSVLLRP